MHSDSVKFSRERTSNDYGKFLGLLPEEREALDAFAFAQNLLERGGEVERRFALISLDNSVEV
jgi:hypothetical protein